MSDSFLGALILVVLGILAWIGAAIWTILTLVMVIGFVIDNLLGIVTLNFWPALWFWWIVFTVIGVIVLVFEFLVALWAVN